MPSPFPGMDPYLEGSTWMSFHGSSGSEIVRQLGPKLRPRYMARIDRRFLHGDPVEADTSRASSVSRRRRRRDQSRHRNEWSRGTRNCTAPVAHGHRHARTVLHFSVEIRDRRERRLVRRSKSFRRPTSAARDATSIVAKRNRILPAYAHLIEIDLLRKGGACR